MVLWFAGTYSQCSITLLTAELIKFCCHDEVVLVQALYFLGLQRDCRVPPPKADLWMMAFSFRQLANTFHKGEGLCKVVEPERPLDAPILIEDRPFGRIAMILLHLICTERRDATAAGGARFAGEGFGVHRRAKYYTAKRVSGTRVCESW